LPYGGDLTAAQETAGESVVGLTGAWTAASGDTASMEVGVGGTAARRRPVATYGDEGED
jgi:hypothetical protein